MMDNARFDALILRLTTVRSRRNLLVLLMSGLLATPYAPTLPDAAGKKGKGKKKRKKKRPASRSGGPSPIIAQCAAVQDSSVTKNDAEAWYAQTFPAQRTGYLRRAELIVEKFGPVNDLSGDYVVQIVNVAADGKPSIGSILAETRVADEAVGLGFAPLVADFPEGEQAAITAGTRYALVVRREAVYLKVGAHYHGPGGGDGCPNSELFGGSSLSPDAIEEVSWDLPFTVSV